MPTAVIAAFQNNWRERYEVLLTSAVRLGEEGFNEAAIVTAQTACEVYVETVLTAAIRRTEGSERLIAALEMLQPRPYSLNNDRVRGLYELFSGHRIDTRGAVWSRFKEHVKRRHEIVHGGRAATPEEASDSITAVRELVSHMQRNAKWE